MPRGRQPSGGHAPELTLRALVSLSGVPASTVHHYRRLGLLPAPAAPRPGRFAYSERHLRALQLIRELREERAMPLCQIKDVLPALLEGKGPVPPALLDSAGEPQQRLIDAAFKLFSEPKGYAAVTVSEIAAAAGVAKGTVYRHFPSKEALFTAVVESLCQDTADRFAQAVADLGGAEGLASDPAKTASVFGRLIARAMPILLELGARAARGDFASRDPRRPGAPDPCRGGRQPAVRRPGPCRPSGHRNGLCHRLAVGRRAGLGPPAKARPDRLTRRRAPTLRLRRRGDRKTRVNHLRYPSSWCLK